ncbi:zinc ribbon domain-containing protein [Pseudonocardia sp. NPDC046786]|uniref:zinc ribbon domain-containing protein n=1 Tax=Pseudonocardia sp. NPDC046786 TaxID=3155471 RepID=UPI0033E18B96
MLRPATHAVGPAPPPDTSYPSPTAPAAAAPAAADTLQELADADRPYTDQLVGYWVPQVSSKQVGVDGYDAPSNLREHRSTGSTRPDTPFLLVRSEDFSSFRSGGFWVTVAAVPHYTADEANQWCDSQGYPARDCDAKRLSHTEGSSGNAKPRG